MTSAEHDDPDAGFSPAAVREMEMLGVKPVRAYHFLVGNYRYTNLEDAIAQAKRQKQSAEEP